MKLKLTRIPNLCGVPSMNFNRFCIVNGSTHPAGTWSQKMIPKRNDNGFDIIHSETRISQNVVFAFISTIIITINLI